MINEKGAPWVLSQRDVRGFSLPGDAARYESQLLLDHSTSGSADLQVYRFVLSAGQRMDGEVHEANDECYYGLSGAGTVSLRAKGDEEETSHEIGPGTLIFMPAGTFHRLENLSSRPLVVLSMWPREPASMGNKIAEGRMAAWGESLILRPKPGRHHV